MTDFPLLYIQEDSLGVLNNRKMSKILVPTDFSDFSNNALRFATGFAREKGMTVKILHIIEDPGVLGKIPFLNEPGEKELNELEATTRDNLERLALLEKSNEIKVEYEVRRTKKGVAHEILSEECDLIIMGRRRLENDQVLLTGSVAEKIVRLSSVPVLTVGYLSTGFQIKKIVFAADFHETSIQPIIQRVIDLATIFKAELHFLNVLLNREFLNEKVGDEKAKEIRDKFDLGESGLEIYFAPTAEEGITDYITNSNPDLLAMCTHGRRGLPHFFIGSVAENMADYLDIPVLTYNISPKNVKESTKGISRERIKLSERSKVEGPKDLSGKK